MNTRILLITGGAGFIGTNFIRYWLHTYPKDKLIVLDSISYASNIKNLEFAKSSPNFSFIQGSINNTVLVKSLIEQHSVNTIVHFAAESHVDRSISSPDPFIETNIVGTYSLLKAAKAVWLDGNHCLPHHFHHISTDEVFGSLADTSRPFNEQSRYAPNSIYSASKAASDHLIRAFHQTYGMKVTTSNTSNNFGPYQFPEKLIPSVITKLLNNQSLPIYGDGQQTRDWLHVADHVYATDLILNKGSIGETYTIGGNSEKTNIYIVETICKLVDQAFQQNPMLSQQYPKARSAISGSSADLIAHVVDRLGHDKRYAIDNTKAQIELGYAPKIAFDEGLKETVDWYINNPHWWSKPL
ncbi:dTDP-glucose 4,6-dehydratase [Echinimonas agarilytica]|uniref:dTDP-glucose 4,6-dehydratase n=1 Tax=Echinimonas agarilytica TaxID=1215918 RepID=A0AA41W6K7_9GAMM|nr:dTDP-glucose 4,6-dehydratase [Echinimonas agarilytica]MCM2679499.1 dTDP-glucose 4,6-dehydratase [Echinimonas agarilytica]